MDRSVLARTRAACGGVLLLGVMAVRAQDVGGLADRISDANIGRNLSVEGGVVGFRATAPGTPWSATFGISRARGADGSHSLGAPLALGYSGADWSASLSAGGYTRRTGNGSSGSGVGDLTAFVNRQFEVAQFSVAPYAKVMIPAKGDVGSPHGSETLGIALVRNIFDRWTFFGKVAALRRDVPSEGASRYTRFAVAIAKLTETSIRSGDSAFVQWDRGLTHGATGATNLRANYSAPIAGDWSGSLTTVFAFTGATRARSAEFDISLAF